jgi:hypothetical protein
MRFRTLALALALSCGLAGASVAKNKPPKFHPVKFKKVKDKHAKESRAAKVKPRKAKKPPKHM